MRFLGAMSARNGASWLRGTKVIVRTNRGLEVGEILCNVSPGDSQNEAENGCQCQQDEGHQSGGCCGSSAGQILREMSSQDSNELAHIEADRKSVV